MPHKPDPSITHPDYDLRLPQWAKCRDFAGGTDRVKAAGMAYLPPLSGQPAAGADYDHYLQRAFFYPATERTVTGLTGLITRKEPAVEVPRAVESHLADLTLDGQSFNSILLRVVTDDITVGRIGFLLDWAQGGTRPYWTIYDTTNIVNWRKGVIETDIRGRDSQVRHGLTMVVLREVEEQPDVENEFATTSRVVYRVLEIKDGAYHSTVWRPKIRRRGDVEEVEWIPDESVVPERRGKALLEIPFITIGTREADIRPEKPPIKDLVDVNHGHYLNSADAEWSSHWVATPTPWIAGVKPGDQTFYIGSSRAWVFSDPSAKAAMLEVSGAGHDTLFKQLAEKKQMMAELGARLVSGQPRVNETAEAVRLRQASDAASLQTVVGAVNIGLDEALRWHAWWMGDDAAFTSADAVQVQVNDDFFETALTPQQEQILVMELQSGAISYETFFWRMRRGGSMRPDVTLEEELAAIERDMALPIRTKPDPEPDPEPET